MHISKFGLASVFGVSPLEGLLPPSSDSDIIEMLEQMEKYTEASRELDKFEVTRSTKLAKLVRHGNEIEVMSNKLKTKLLNERSIADANERTRQVAMKAASVVRARARRGICDKILIALFLIYLVCFWY
mmetsp:Transcript_21474/g.44177  ORF Transcript_21474/g.44177 Transcript_21474/m.44177 type:complete len:129 (+) Transcript_21474:2871-3257(+)